MNKTVGAVISTFAIIGRDFEGFIAFGITV